MDLSPERLAAQLASPLRPAYLIAGQEPLRVLEAADAVRAAARAQGIGEREIFEAQGNQREPDWDALVASFRAPGLFSARRLIELRLPSGKPGKTGSAAIVEFCAEPPADVVLLVTTGDWSRSHAGKWSEAIARVGVVAVGWAVKPHELPDWIDRRLRERGLQADRAAVQRLAERVEGNLLAAAQEIDKLQLLLAQGEASGDPRERVAGDARARVAGSSGPSREPLLLTAQMMDELVADAARFDVFRLLDAVLNGQGPQVARMLRGLRAEGTAVPALLGMVTMELQRAAALARVQARGGNLAAEFRAQRVWDARQAGYRRALQRHAAARWERFVIELGAVDRISKGRGVPGRDPGDAWIALERLLLAVAEPEALALLAR